MTNKPNDGSSDMSQLPAKKDTFLVKPFILVAGIILIGIAIWYADNSNLPLLLIDLLALTIVMAFLLLSIMHVVRGRYKSALSLILANLALILAFVLPSNGERNFGYARDAADYIKFSLHEKQYLEAIKLTQKNDGGLRYKEFIWSFRFGGEGSRLVYDESDELGLPNDRRSQAWWTNLNNHSRRYFEDCIKGLYKIKPHYYVVRLTCG